jgi:CheY-like chemotaxis protein
MAEGAREHALHGVRSALARVRGELELLELDGTNTSDAQAAVDDALRALARAEEPAEAAKRRVVLLDDDLRLAELTARRLRRGGLDVAVVGEVAEALREVEAQDVLIADLGCLSAASPAERLLVRRLSPIIVSGGASSQSQALAAAMGARAFFLKPVDATALVAAINARPAAEPS